MFQINRLDRTLICGWYAIVVRWLTLRYLQTNVRSLHSVFDVISVRVWVRTSNETIQWSKNIFAMCINMVLNRRIARASLEYQSDTAHMHWLSYLVLGNVLVYTTQRIREVLKLERVVTVAFGDIYFRLVRGCRIWQLCCRRCGPYAARNGRVSTCRISVDVLGGL